MNTTKVIILMIFLGSVMLISGCKDDPVPVNPEELITFVKVTLKEEGGGLEYFLTWEDIDGAGGELPAVNIPSAIEGNKTYIATIEILNELVAPTLNVTDEVIEEGTDHQLFYQVTPGSFPMGISYDPDDSLDLNGKNIGIVTRWNISGTGETGADLRIILKHQPNKTSILAIDDPDSAGGETDMDISFNGITLN